MRSFKRPNRDQKLLFLNVDLDSLAPEGSPVRIIDELIESLDTGTIESSYDLESVQGREPIHPKTILKVVLFAIHNCRFSLRKMEADTKSNILYQWLTGQRSIDHSTIGKFLSRFTKEITELFTQVVYTCVEHNLVDFDILAIDSVKLRAYASYKASKTQKALKKELKRVKDRISELIEKAILNPTEVDEFDGLVSRKSKIQRARRKLEERIREKGENKPPAEKEKIEQKEKINLTDPDAHIMKQRNGEQNPAYSVTTATDASNDIITAIRVNEYDKDTEALLPVVQASGENTQQPHETYCADPAFSSLDNMESLDEEDVDILMPDRRMKIEESGQTKKGKYDRSHFVFNTEENTYRCPAGESLPLVREALINGREYAVYENAVACSKCKNRSRCTKGKTRKILRDEREILKEKMRIKFRKKKNKMRYKKRAHVAESPYGHLKQNLKFRNTYRRGKEKIRMEFSLIGILHNGLKLSGMIVEG